MRIYNARLIGGPHDGDSGAVPYLAERIWAYSCSEPGCPKGGIHWADRYDDAGPDPAAYDLMEEDGPEDGVWPYVYAELTEPLAALTAEELARA